MIIFCAAMGALNAALYVTYGVWWNLASAIFCAAMGLASLVGEL